MPGRDPDAQARSTRVSKAIRDEMTRQGLTNVALAEKLREHGVHVPNDMWIARRLTGQVNLVEPVKVVYGPTDDLEAIADVLGVKADRFVRVINSTRKPAPSAAADK